MAYELHIEGTTRNEESDRTPLALGDWKVAVSQTEGVRLSSKAADTLTNPKTGEVLRIPRREGDVEVYFPDERAWYGVFRWFDGAAHFNARFEPGDRFDPVWAAAAALASRMGAAIRGDDGEAYDLETGEVTDA
jgi:hypothetical protein